MFDKKIYINVDKEERLSDVQNIVNGNKKKSLWQRFCDYFHLTPKIYLDLNNIPDDIIIQIGNKKAVFQEEKKEIQRIQPTPVEKFIPKQQAVEKSIEQKPKLRQFCIKQNGSIVPIESIKKFSINDIKI